MSIQPFNPDSSLVAEVIPSPNFGERVGERLPDMILLHYSGMPEPQGALEWLCSPRSKVSAHYYVFEDGRIVQMVPEALRAWHAGEGFWANDTDINSCSIGIEIANPGHEWGYRPFPGMQLEAVSALCKDVVDRWRILPERVLAHSDVAPMRKEDPGELFDWRRLAEAGVGLHVEPAPIGGGRFLAPGDRGQPVDALQLLFASYGYEIEPSGVFDPPTEAVVRAFQRHFRQERVDGIADASTIETLKRLLDRRQRAFA
jgi:N-acetylmuramoyl-L-alanine amidase